MPEGGHLVPRRPDSDFFTGDISQEMFEYLEYSRSAIADISVLNPNVFYELGVGYRAHEAATADGFFATMAFMAITSLARSSTVPASPTDGPYRR